MLDICAVLAFVFIINFAAVFVTSGLYSDHPVHIFLVRCVKQNGRRLFSTVPRILNKSRMGAYPIFLHYLLAWLPESSLKLASYLLCPVVSLLICIAQYTAMRVWGYDANLMIWVLLLTAITPQFFHVSSARVAGISSRGLGILFAYCFFQCFPVQDALHEREIAILLLAVLCAYLVWAFNTFALQTLVIATALLFVVFHESWPLLCFSAGGGVFVVLHFQYATSYIWQTIRFINNYRLEVCKLFILPKRHSIWRDLVKDIPLQVRSDWKKGVLYAYGNSVIIAIVMNPLYFIAFLNRPDGGWLEFQWILSLVGCTMFLGTTLRSTRFLGEPERYLELFTLMAIPVAVHNLSHIDSCYIPLFLTWYLFANGLQFFYRIIRAKRTKGLNSRVIDSVARIVEDHARRDGVLVSFASNNEDITKRLMDRNWQFVRFWSSAELCAGFRFVNSFVRYPILKPGVFCEICKFYQVSYVVVDRTVLKDESQIHFEGKVEVLGQERGLEILLIKWPQN